MVNQDLNTAQTNPWIARSRKLALGIGVAAIEIANVWTTGPEWVYIAASGIGALLIYLVPNAPKYVDPRDTATAQRLGRAIH